MGRGCGGGHCWHDDKIVIPRDTQTCQWWAARRDEGAVVGQLDVAAELEGLLGSGWRQTLSTSRSTESPLVESQSSRVSMLNHATTNGCAEEATLHTECPVLVLDAIYPPCLGLVPRKPD